MPKFIWKHQDLKIRNLGGNEIKVVSKKIGRLQKLDLRWNNNLKIPKWIFELEKRGCLVYF